MGSPTATPAALAGAVERSMRELAQRLEGLNQAPGLTKMAHGRYVAAAFFELTQHQAHFNVAVAEELAAHRAHLADLAPKGSN